MELYRRKLMAMLDAGLVSLALRGSGLAGSSKNPSTKVQLTTSRTASANGGAASLQDLVRANLAPRRQSQPAAPRVHR